MRIPFKQRIRSLPIFSIHGFVADETDEATEEALEVDDTEDEETDEVVTDELEEELVDEELSSAKTGIEAANKLRLTIAAAALFIR